jgi:hypothetical protein
MEPEPTNTTPQVAVDVTPSKPVQKTKEAEIPQIDPLAVKLQNITNAATKVFDHYRSTHIMKDPEDFGYPGFKELYQALNS